MQQSKQIIFIQSPQYSQYAEKIAKLESQIFPEDFWSASSILQVLTQFGGGLLVAEGLDDGQIMAYCIYQQVFEAVDIHRIATHPNFLRQGLATKLIQALSFDCQKKQGEDILLEVRADNISAIQLYQKMGFERIDIRQGYYHLADTKIDAWIMKKSLL